MHIALEGMKIPLYPAAALVIGAGAAGLNCADELAKRGVDVILAAQDFGGGASLDAGSDKQTYHKLSAAGDSIRALAEDYFAGGHMHGDTALALAAGSAAAFYKLVELGVPFPHDRWGEYAGYRTDHDEKARATSAGPLTSRYMAESLRESVSRRGIRRVKGALIRLLTRDGAVCGALFYDHDALRRGLPPICAVSCRSVALCTGGAADLYEQSVYPLSQIGAMGAALRIGAQATNLWSWQYGIASTNVRWNLSGTYQQALPHYHDTLDCDILEPWIHDGNPDDAVFLKGYQWPFDSRKLSGSSRVDLAVYYARDVLMDFSARDAYKRLDALGEEARGYLRNSCAEQKSAYDRLTHMNPAAVELFLSRGVDLSKEALPVALCAQHQNGGLSVDSWWRTTLPGLYAAGEVSGCFGAYRPGGSALNETQVGSLRVAQHIAAQGISISGPLAGEALRQIEEETHFLRDSAQGNGEDALKSLNSLRREFSLCAGPVRDPSGMRALANWVERRLDTRHNGEPLDVLRLRDALLCARSVLSSMILQAQAMPCPAGHVVAAGRLSPGLLPESPDNRYAGFVIETTPLPGGAHSAIRPARPLPEESDRWFENVWRDFREGLIFRDEAVADCVDPDADVPQRGKTPPPLRGNPGGASRDFSAESATVEWGGMPRPGSITDDGGSEEDLS